MFLELKSIHKRFEGLKVVENLHLSLEKGQLLCILGSSGCGKTTTLNMIGGFLTPDSGTIALDGADITAIPPRKTPRVHGVPVLRSVPSHDGAGERDLRPEIPGLQKASDP